MLTSLLIRNFQAHKSLEIQLDQITTICGPSDIGKSAILRALYWLCMNRPSGEAFLREGAHFVSVRLGVDGRTIKRKKGKANTYSLDGEVFKAFGSAVPEEIAKLLNVTEENFQGQHDSPFWFSKTPGQVSKELNRIVSLEVIDNTLSNIASRMRREQERVNLTKQRLEDAKEHKRELIWVPDLDSSLKKLEETTRDIADKRARLAGLRGLIVLGQKYTKARANAGQTQERLKEIVITGGQALELQRRAETLQLLIDQAEWLQHLASSRKQQATHVEQELHTLTKGRCPICRRTFNE